MSRGVESPQACLRVRGVSPASGWRESSWRSTKLAIKVSHKLCNCRHLGIENQGAWWSPASLEPLSTRFWKGSPLELFAHGSVRNQAGFQEHLLAFPSSRLSQLEPTCVSLSVSPAHGGFLPYFRQWKTVSQQRADLWSLGIWQIWIGPGPRHLLPPVHSLKQQALFLNLRLQACCTRAEMW